jgi:release factor glutamine methyltransferase
MLNVGPAVLVPRPETETIVETALDALARGGLRMEALRILDIGTGSGALLLALLSEMPNAIGLGTDISVAALAIARENAQRNGLTARCRFVASNIADALIGPFDLIVSNPPYVMSGDIATLAPDVSRVLAVGGRLIVELGAGQEPAVRALFTKVGLKVGSARKDLAGIPRALPASLMA